MGRMIYFDHSATTPVDPRVLEAMLPYFTEQAGNPSGIYGWARQAKKALEEAREQVADVLLCSPNEVIFTGSGTEGANTALKGVAWARRDRGRHIITTQIEHHCVLHTCQWLEKEGFEVTYLPVDQQAVVDLNALREAVRPDTILVSIMYANNEVGTIEPLPEAVRLVREQNPDTLFHTHAVQAAGALYVRRGTPLVPLLQGGGQEKNRRSGTENIPLVVGLATALRLAHAEQAERNAKCRHLRDRLISGVLDRIQRAQLTGHPTQRLPNHASFVFEGIEGESILLNLDVQGVCASAGSACSATSLEPSHVLRAMGLPPKLARGALRLSVGHENTDEEVDYVLDLLPQLVQQLHTLSTVSVHG